jgi:glyoxylase-like metal-dependent hydrolase (beta-lactamase superfamily II)
MSGTESPTAAPPALPEPPADGDCTGLPGGILWIRLPVPGGLRHINVWLLPGRQGWTLVDTGMDTGEVRRAWVLLGERLRLRQQLRGIVVTHHHPDHFGMVRWLADRYHVRVYMTPPARAAAGESLAAAASDAPSRLEDFAARHGLELDDDMRQILRGGIYRAIVSGGVEAAGLEDGCACPGAENWTVSVHAGHAPGHACLYDGAAGVLVSGDQLLPSISSNISLYPSNEQEDPLAQYLASLRALCELPTDTLVLPSHGRPFTGLHARARAVRIGHEARLSNLHRALGRPSGTMEAAAGLFRLGRLDALNRLLALTETLAHLRWLECRGLVTRRGAGRALRWTAAGAVATAFAAQED